MTELQWRWKTSPELGLTGELLIADRIADAAVLPGREQTSQVYLVQTLSEWLERCRMENSQTPAASTERR
ncbi:MAG: hypothetical protein MUF72_13095 [Elainella sp. Prado103]|jgi:hypothetical protein|nr:hypothetical protein [Elainella sp. Prado103]